MASRTRNAARNIIWGMVEKVVLLLLPFVTRTIMIKTLGAEYLGLNSLFSSVLQVLSISELGIGSAIVFSMYKPIASNDKVVICALLNYYRKIYYIIGSIILGCGILISPFLRLLIKGDVPDNIDIYVLFYIYLFNTVIGYFFWGYKVALFSAHQRNDLTSKRNTIVSMSAEIIKIASLLLFQSYYTYVIIIPIATMASNILNTVLANKMYPDIKCYGNITVDTKKDLKKRISGLVSFKIYNVVFSSVDTIVISSFLGLTPLAIFNNYYYVQTAIAGFLTIITNSITAGVGNKMITNSIEENYIDYKKVVFLNGWIVSWSSICLVCLYQHFMKLWVGSQLLFPFVTMLMMVLYFYIPKMTAITFTYREAAGLWWEDRIRPLISSVVNLILNLFLVNIVGIDGVLISTLICSIFINIPWGTYVLFKKYFNFSPKEYFITLIYYTVITAFAGATTLAICSLLSNEGYLYLILKFILCMIVPNMLFIAAYHKKDEFNYVKTLCFDMVKKMIRKG